MVAAAVEVTVVVEVEEVAAAVEVAAELHHQLVEEVVVLAEQILEAVTVVVEVEAAVEVAADLHHQLVEAEAAVVVAEQLLEAVMTPTIPPLYQQMTTRLHRSVLLNVIVTMVDPPVAKWMFFPTASVILAIQASMTMSDQQ